MREARDGGNILTMTKMTEIFRIVDDVRALVDDEGRKVEDLCLRVQGSCLTAGIVRYFGSTANFTSDVASDADILAKVNAESFPDGSDAFPSDSMGGRSSSFSYSSGAWLGSLDFWTLLASRRWL